MTKTNADSTKAMDKPIAKPPYPLPAIFRPARRTKYSTRVGWSKEENGRESHTGPATAANKYRPG